MAPPHARNKSGGRKRIEMKLIADENARTVTFSKRRAGLFKKATELSVLCGTQIALIIFSLSGRAYSFGHPNVESVLGRFSNRTPTPTLQDSVHDMRTHAAMLQQFREQYDKKKEELKAQKRKGKEIEAALERSSCQITEERLNLLDYNQLKELKEKMEKFREDINHLASAPRPASVKPSRLTLDVASRLASGPQSGSVKPSNLTKDVAGLVASGPLNPSHLTLDATLRLGIEPQSGSVKPSRLALDVVGPSAPKKVDLANVASVERDASPIPPDWLKL